MQGVDDQDGLVYSITVWAVGIKSLEIKSNDKLLALRYSYVKKSSRKEI